MRGDAAFSDLDPDLVKEAERRRAERTAREGADMFAGEQYFRAVREGRSVHASAEQDRAAVAVLKLAEQRRELQRQIDDLAGQLVEQVTQDTGDLTALSEVAAADTDIRAALEHLAGTERTAEILHGEGAHAS
ncbi:hypothetical protein [Streptomyces sp. cg36]|uniref:hypothetical protein n=1 Tax=Streptomyces sp. cg36 TaxID=3238798 RepID=UPI0034E1B8CE